MLGENTDKNAIFLSEKYKTYINEDFSSLILNNV